MRLFSSYVRSALFSPDLCCVVLSSPGKPFPSYHPVHLAVYGSRSKNEVNYPRRDLGATADVPVLHPADVGSEDPAADSINSLEPEPMLRDLYFEFGL